MTGSAKDQAGLACMARSPENFLVPQAPHDRKFPEISWLLAASLAPGRDLMSRESASASRVSRLNGTLLTIIGVTASRFAQKSAYRGDMCTGRGAVVSSAARQIIGGMGHLLVMVETARQLLIVT